MTTPRLLLDGLTFGESPRWRHDRLWVSDWGAGEIHEIAPNGASRVAARHAAFPMCIDFLGDGSLLVVDSGASTLLRQSADGALEPWTDLGAVGAPPWNDVVVGSSDRVYVNNTGFDFPLGEFRPGFLVLAAAGEEPQQVADDLHFPNGMVITADGSTLVVAESYASRLTGFDLQPDGSLTNRRVWADLGDGVPDGICLDAEGAIWYADVPNRCCVRVREGGEVLARIELDRGCFACALGGPEGRTLYLVATEWNAPEGMGEPARTGQVLAVEVEVPRG